MKTQCSPANSRVKHTPLPCQSKLNRELRYALDEEGLTSLKEQHLPLLSLYHYFLSSL